MPVISANGVQTFYREIGDGPLLLLIAGNGMDHTTFDEQLPEFSRHFRCITYDMRGIGRSDVPANGYSTRVMAEDALALLAHLDAEAAHVGGYSLGGAIAQEMALAAPERVRTLSLYATYDRPDPYLRLRYELLLKILLETSPEIWATFTAFTAFGQSYVNEHAAEVRAEIEKRVKRWRGPDAPSKQGLAGHYRAILSHDAADRLGAIRCPTWIAVGALDPVTPVAYSRRIHAAIPASELEIFPGSPHRLLNFQSAAFTQKALGFLLGHC